MIMYLFMYTSR